MCKLRDEIPKLPQFFSSLGKRLVKSKQMSSTFSLKSGNLQLLGNKNYKTQTVPLRAILPTLIAI